MLRRFLSTLVLLPIVSLFVYTVLLNPAGESSRASQDPMVINKTIGCEIKAQILGDLVTITLRNNHGQTITAFTIQLGDAHGITADFAYSEVHSGIVPGEVFQESYPLPRSLTGSVPTVSFLTVLLENGSHDGDFATAQRIRDERLGEKIQILRTLKILDKQENFRKEPKVLKDELVAALSTLESETLTTLNELQVPDGVTGRQDNKQLSDGVKEGLQIGREGMVRRLARLEQFPNDSRETAFMELKMRLSKLLTKL